MFLKYLRHEGNCVQCCWCSLVTKNMAVKYMEPFYALCRKLKKNSRVSLNPVAILRTPLPQQRLKKCHNSKFTLCGCSLTAFFPCLLILLTLALINKASTVSRPLRGSSARTQWALCCSRFPRCWRSIFKEGFGPHGSHSFVFLF